MPARLREDPRRPGYLRLHVTTPPPPPRPIPSSPDRWAKVAQESLERSRARRQPRRRRLWWWYGVVAVVLVVALVLGLLWLVKSWA